MASKRKWFLSACLLTMLAAGGLLSGCATSAQLEDLRMKVDQALQEAQHATEMAKSTESKCLALKTDATEEYRATGAAADRAERAAKSAMDSANRAEAAAQKTQDLYDRIMSK